MLTLHRLYHPIPADPFQQDDSYREMAPCEALRPYVRCFWGTTRPLWDTGSADGASLVIPDTCMDVIFDVDHTAGTIAAGFCALDETSGHGGSCIGSGHIVSTFGIRFYAWTACLFSEDSLRRTRNGAYPAEQFFPRLCRMLTPLLTEEPTLAGRIRHAERALLSLLQPSRLPDALPLAMHLLLQTEGRCRVDDLCRHTALTPRTLERLFDAHMGVSPKIFASLVRYQLLWQHMALSPRFDGADAALRFGYADQAHMLNDFRRRHLMSPREAIARARC